MNIELPVRTPTSVLFFVTAAAFAFLSADQSFMIHFAWSSLWWFLFLGPSRWVFHLIEVPLEEGGDGVKVAIGGYYVAEFFFAVAGVVALVRGLAAAGA